MIKYGLAYLDTLPIWAGTLDFSLELPRRLMKALGNPQDRVCSVHVAGTNGKGSTSAFLAAILRVAGNNVAQLASPHLTSVTERCIINGSPVDPDVLAEAIDQVVHFAQSEHLSPSYFELVTAASFVVCAQMKLDWMVVEVGLGGRLDATNVLSRPQASIITSIDYDHTHVLGKTLREIAREKGGIVRSDVPVFVGRVGEEAENELREIAVNLGTSISFLGRDFGFGEAYSENMLKSAAMPGEYQLDNAALAAGAAYFLGLPESIIRLGIKSARWPGRLERIQTVNIQGSTVNVILDAAHNPQGMDSLLQYLSSVVTLEKYRKLVFILSFLQTKDWSGMLRQIVNLGFASVQIEYVFTSSAHPQAVPTELLVSQIPRAESVSSAREALRGVMDRADEETLVVVAGSIYLLGEVRHYLIGESFSTFERVVDPFPLSFHPKI